MTELTKDAVKALILSLQEDSEYSKYECHFIPQLNELIKTEEGPILSDGYIRRIIGKIILP